tara:strand:- start:7426 stop:7629 length:204 start_codon:yes stop_codon:yes gene_type:complete
MNSTNDRGLVRTPAQEAAHQRRLKVRRLRRRFPPARYTSQRSYHGGGQHSIQFFDVVTGDLAADYNL